MSYSVARAATAVTIVDDHPAVLDVLMRAAHSWQFACQAAASAEQALPLLERAPTPLLVTDLRMPGRGGLWLVREVRERWPHVGIIVITAGHDVNLAIECLNLGAKRYFLKPINLDEFKHALDSAYEGYCLERGEEERKRQLEAQVARQTRKIRRTYLDAIEMMVSTLEARDSYTSGHSLRVRDYALRLARALGWSSRDRKRISLAAKLHDVGKLGVPESILLKPGRLTSEEEQIIRQHSAIGERILSRVVHNREVLAAIRGHHERLDGSGYPDGLKGSQISPLARLIAIADTFDALTSSRAYRSALPIPKALAVLEEGAGTQFDAGFVRVFVESLAPHRPAAIVGECFAQEVLTV